MPIELSVRGAGLDQSQSMVVQSGIALTRAADVAVAGSDVVGHEKLGRDLSVRLADGRSLTIGDFFVIDPDGDFSRLLDHRGEPVVTGLAAPEPSLADMGPDLAAQSAMDGGVDAIRDPAGEGANSEEETLFGGGSTMLSAGAGLAAGYGSMSLISGEEDGDGGDEPATPLPSAVQADTDAQALQQEIDDLLGVPDDALSIALAEELAHAVQGEGDPGAADHPDAPPAHPETAAEDTPLLLDATQISDAVPPAPDLLMPLTVEGEP